MILPAPLLTLDKYSSWRVWRVVPTIRSAVRTTLRSLLRSDLVAELNQTVIDVQRTDSMMAGKQIILPVKLSKVMNKILFTKLNLIINRGLVLDTLILV